MTTASIDGFIDHNVDRLHSQLIGPGILPYRTARDFDTRPGLKYLLMKVSGVCGAANLYRQSVMSFNLYFQVLLCATLSQADGVNAQQVGPACLCAPGGPSPREEVLPLMLSVCQQQKGSDRFQQRSKWNKDQWIRFWG